MRIALDLSPLSPAFRTAFTEGVRRVAKETLAALRRSSEVECVEVAAPAGASLARWRQTRCVKELDGAVLLHSWSSAIPLRSPVPVVQTVHEAPWKNGAMENAGLGHRFWAFAGARRAALVVTPSARVAADLGGHRRLRVIPWGVDGAFSDVSDASDDALRAACPELPADPFCLVLGGTRPKKRLDLVLAGAAQAGATVVCTGPASPEASSLAAGPGAIHLTGEIDGQLIPALLRRAGCLAVLSTSEGFALPVLEAMRCGTPVIVARDTVQSETAAGFGIEVDPADAGAVAAAIRGTLSSTLTSEESHAASAYARTMTWDRTAAALVDAWRSVL